MSGHTRASMHKVVAFFVCTLLCTALLSSPGAWAQKYWQAGDRTSFTNAERTQKGQDSDYSSLKQTSELPTSDRKRIQSEEGGNSSTCDEQQGSQATAQDKKDSPAAINPPPKTLGHTFTSSVTVGTNTKVPCTFKVTHLSPNEVQVGSGVKVGTKVVNTMVEYYFEQSIPKEFKGDLILPMQVMDESGTSFNVTKIGDGAFQFCHITSTGLANNPSVLTLGEWCYIYSDITTTGLETNNTITKIGKAAFHRCYHLKSTGLGENDTVESVADVVFSRCTALEHTGLETNCKLTLLRAALFQACSKLESTGLAENKTVTTIEDNVFGYAPLTSTGLEHNTTVKTLGSNKDSFGVFQHCSKLTSTGLESNHSISTIGSKCFTDCTSLGSEPDVTGATNTGDLVLNQPIANGKPVPLKIGSNAFKGTGYTSLYPRGGKDMLAPVSDAFSGSHIHTMYVEKSWTGTSTYNVGGLNLSSANGTLIVMDPKLTGLKASRVAGTSDSALLSFTTNHGFKINISKTDNTSLGDYRVSLPATETGQMQEATYTIPAGAGLTPGPEELRASIDKFIYPLDAKAQDYNSLPGTSLSCTLDPVTYTIHFDAHGGSDTMDNQQVTYGRGEKLHPCTFSVDNMTFRHWSTDAQDQGPTNASYDNEALTDSIPPQQGVTLTLFAQWETGLQVLSTHTNSNPLAGVSYELSKSDQEPIQPLEGLSSDPEGQNPIHKEGEEGTCWPLVSDAQGAISMYWLSEGTYYLYNVRVPAGYNAASSPMKVEVSHKDGKAFVTVNGNEVSTYKDATAQMSIAFVESPSLPTTGNLPAGLLQGMGALVVSALGIVALRRVRKRKQGC